MDGENVLRWGILALARNILYQMAMGYPDCSHHMLAGEFPEKTEAPEYCLVYSGYSELDNGDYIDVVFIANPHSHHFPDTMLALEAGNPVVCQKSLTANAPQARKLFETATRKQRFLMEGWWTYWPQAKLAGGALLDVLALHWILLAPLKEDRRPAQVSSSIKTCPVSVIDETTTIIMNFLMGGREIRAIAQVSIEGSDGTIKIHGREYVLLSEPFAVTPYEEGLQFILGADEVARCISEGLLKSHEMPWEESLLVMEIMDTVPEQNNLQIPPEIESLGLPPSLLVRT
ncbi:hypothetical protein BDV23DRAFT_192845 [Aspergillus alliaceus]|uniref:D-xylose 1-dehydrogenase (NADP(+), D-xylono-1,5-lactone-forming) n=1 Tax=Petromyces alliaceus TaxID=209559 RepID=A0A5N7CCZ9_PETAA|nr:hypothetical protein BDV23DRAFT_192845 [Aspergillus alliaceus]